MIDIDAVINLHREGQIALPSLRSASVAAEEARAAGLQVKLNLVLDRSDAETLALAEEFAARHDAVLHQVAYGDLSKSRNHAVDCSSARFLGFLDGDDLWSSNWLIESYRFSVESGERTICHPAWNVIFGAKQVLFPHPDQLDRKFSKSELLTRNCWTALSFARREIYAAFPYQPNRLDLGFGFEDWAWNLVTIENGYVHRAVPGTTHFIRYKTSDSLRDRTTGLGGLRTPPDLDQLLATARSSC